MIVRWSVIAFSLVAAGCGAPSSKVNDDALAPAVVGGYYMPAGYTLVPYLSDSPMHQFAAADKVLDIGKDYLAVVETDAGKIVIDLFESKTPITVNSFVFLTLHHYFDGIAFHRVIDGFVAQGGDPNTLDTDTNGWGQGGPGYQFGLEIDKSLNFDAAGVVGMARASDPNSNGSQFYITLAAATNLDGQYTVFGKVTEGLSTLPLLTRGEPPAKPSRMIRVYAVVK